MAASGPQEGEPPPRLTVAVDDLASGLWGGRIKQELEARVPLRNVQFSLSRAAVAVEELPIRYLDARGDAQLQRLRQLSHSPVAWFRSPLVHVVLASCSEYEDYKRDLRLRLKAMADTESTAPGQPELLFVYVRPAGADPTAKGPAKVFDAMRRDLNRPKRERCVRLDPVLPGAAPAETGTPVLLGLEEYERQLKDALRAGFEARAAAYAEEVRRLMLNRLDPSWSFSTLFLVKDGLAAMLEAAGLLEDALREYSELEACYLEALQSSQQPKQPFGGKAAGEDEAALLWSPWASTRQAASQPELPPEWMMRQALFASQARLLLKLHRHTELAERGLAFARSFAGLLAHQERTGAVPAQLREAWSFAAHLSLAEATSRLQAQRAEEKRRGEAGRGGGRRARMSDVSLPPPGSPGAGGPDTSLPVPIPLSPSALGITGLQVKAKLASSDIEGAVSPKMDTLPPPQVDWQLGVLPGGFPPLALAESAAGGRGGGREGAAGGGTGSASLYCLLGKLYCAARMELLRLGAAAGLDLPKTAAAAAAAGLAEPRQHAPPLPPGAAAGAAAPPDAPPARQPAAAPAAAAVAAAAIAAAAEGGISEAPSTTDLMAQVDLGAPSGSSSSERQQSAEQAASDSFGQASGDHAAAADALGIVGAPVGHAEAEAEADGASGSGPASARVASPRQVAPAPLQRVSVRSKGEGDSPGSSPRSASTQQSSLPHALSDAQSDAGHAVAPASHTPQPLPALQAAAEQNDMRTAERQVSTALSALDRPSARGRPTSPVLPPPPSPPPAAAAASASLPPWLVHWRLRAALSSQQLFAELFIELSEAAARCYTQCGFLRNAAMLRADVADALAKAGSMQRAAELYERQCRTFLREGWHALAAATLPKLAACQLATGSPGLAHTAAALLSLPAPFRGSTSERSAACQLLLQAARAADGLARSHALLPTSPTTGGAEGGINLSAVVFAAPPKAAVSRFFGRCSQGGAPVLVPPPREPGSPAGSAGALSAAVGDALAVQLVVRSQLPVALPLREAVLTLGVLQEMTVIHSPRAASTPRPVPLTPIRPPGSQLRTSAPATPLAAGSHSLEPADSLGRERFESQWQQVEELACSLVSLVSGDASSGGGGGEGPVGDASGLRPLAGEVVLPPGVSTLTFLAAPVHRGLYKPLHLQARVQQLPVHVTVEPPKPLWQEQLAEAEGSAAGTSRRSRGSMAREARRRSSRAGVPSGSPLTPTAGGAPISPPAPRPADGPAGSQAAEAVVLQVTQAQPRVQLSLLAAGGSLFAGQEQWMGLALAPERDALQGARLELTWPLGHAPRALPGLAHGAVSRKPTAMAAHHRSVQSAGGDIHLSPAGSAATLPSLTPLLRPEHRAAALLPAGGQQEQAQGEAAAQLVGAETAAGAAASWLLSDGLAQHLALPVVEEGRPVSLWWRVTAAEVPAPPEQVHIAPPAPRHSSRPLDARRLAGLPAEGPAPLAAHLDFPASLEYTSGCQRSHCRMLPAPVRQPFSVVSVARELPAGGVAVQFTLTSNLPVPAQLTRLAFDPQPGFSVTASLLDSMGLLPASLAPAGSLTAAFLLAPESASGAAGGAHAAAVALLPAKLQPSMLAVEYSIDSQQQCGIAAALLGTQQQQQQQQGREGRGGASSPDLAAAGAAAGAPATAAAAAAGQQLTPGADVLDLLNSSNGGGVGAARSLQSRLGRAGVPEGVAESPTAVAAAAGGGEQEDGQAAYGGGLQHCSFRHLLTLELPASEEGTSGTLVYVRLLGPFSATVGQPTTLCWRLERGGQPDQQQAAARVGFEVQAETDHWRPLGRRLGGVTLAGHPGAVATVEATWVPLASGTLPVPALRLQDVTYQEVFDVGQLTGTAMISVAEQAASG